MISALKKKYWKWTAYQEHKNQCRTELLRLRQSPHPAAMPLATAIELTLSSTYTAAEKAYIDKIEAQRYRLSQSNQELQCIDFGAGEPSDPRTLEEAAKGVPRIFKISTLAERSSRFPPWSDLLFHVVNETRRHNGLELGTCIGFSASYICSAMKVSGSGRLTTLEGDPTFSEVARQHLTELSLDNFKIVTGRFQDTLQKTLEECGPFDFVFNDGHHDGEAVLYYFDMMVPFLSDGAILIFDDIKYYTSMTQAWRKLKADPRINLSVDFDAMGLICYGQKHGDRNEYNLVLYNPGR